MKGSGSGKGPAWPGATRLLILLLAMAAFSSLSFLTAAAEKRTAGRDLKELYDRVVKKAGTKYSVDPELIHAVIRAESNYDQFAVSVKGALGLMQLMPATARHYGVLNVFDAAENIEGGVRYLKDLIKLYNGRTSLVLAAYNAGQEAVRRYGGIPPYGETRDYIAGIQSTYNKLYITGGAKIYKYYDKNGRLVLTNDENLTRRKDKAMSQR